MATLGRSPGAAPLTSADIPDNSITGAKIVAGTIEASDVAADMATQAELDLKAPLTNAALVTPNLGTPSAGVVTNLSGVLPVGVTGGSGLTALGTLASGNFDTVFPFTSGAGNVGKMRIETKLITTSASATSGGNEGYYVFANASLSGFASVQYAGCFMVTSDADIRIAGREGTGTSSAGFYIAASAAVKLQSKSVYIVIIGTAS